MDFHLPAEYPLARVLRLRRWAKWLPAHPRFLLMLERRVKEESQRIIQRNEIGV